MRARNDTSGSPSRALALSAHFITVRLWRPATRFGGRSSAGGPRRRSSSHPSRTTSSPRRPRRPSLRSFGATRTSLVSRSSGSSQTIGGERPIPDVHDHVYDAFRRERSNGARLPTLKPSAVRAYAADVRERSLEMLERIDLEAPDVLVRRGFVFGLVLQNELQSQESMLEALQSRTGSEYRRRRLRSARSRTWRTRRDLRPGGHVHARRDLRAVGIRQRARAARHRAPCVPNRPGAGDERRVRGVRRRPWLPLAQALERSRLGLARARGRPRAALLGALELRLGARPLRPDASRSRRGSPCSTSRSTRPRRSRTGRASDSRPSSSGSAPPAGTTTRGSSATRGVRRGWASRRASTAGASRPLPPARTRAGQPRRLRADGRRRLGVDVIALRALSRLPAVPVPGVLRGELRRRRARAPRRLVGDRRARRAHVVPPLGEPGTPRSLRGLPLRARRVGLVLRRASASTPRSARRRGST